MTDDMKALINKTINQKAKLEQYTLAFQKKKEELRLANKAITNLQREKDYLIQVINKLNDEMQVYNQMLLDGFTLDPNLIYSELKRENERLTALLERLQNERY